MEDKPRRLVKNVSPNKEGKGRCEFVVQPQWRVGVRRDDRKVADPLAGNRVLPFLPQAAEFGLRSVAHPTRLVVHMPQREMLRSVLRRRLVYFAVACHAKGKMKSRRLIRGPFADSKI
jgi:hypothetical protein